MVLRWHRVLICSVKITLKWPHLYFLLCYCHLCPELFLLSSVLQGSDCFNRLTWPLLTRTQQIQPVVVQFEQTVLASEHPLLTSVGIFCGSQIVFNASNPQLQLTSSPPPRRGCGRTPFHLPPLPFAPFVPVSQTVPGAESLLEAPSSSLLSSSWTCLWGVFIEPDRRKMEPRRLNNWLVFPHGGGLGVPRSLSLRTILLRKSVLT